MQSIDISGFRAGAQKRNKKPFLLVDDAFQQLQNAYVWREELKKREGMQLIGRFRRSFDDLSLGDSEASPWSFNILNIIGYITAADNANPGQVTTLEPHGLSNGDIVHIDQVLGATGYNTTFTITVVDATNFTVGVDAAAFGAYTSGGRFYSNRSLSTSEPNAEIEPGSVRIYINPTIDTGSITGYTNATDCEFFAPANGLTTGDLVTVSGVTIVPDSGTDSANGEWGGTANYIEALTNSFKIGVDSHTWGVYASGGTWTRLSGGIEFIDQGNGLLTSTTAGNSGYVNYLTGDVVLIHTGGVGAASYVDFSYFPSLPAMGIWVREIPGINDEQTLWFDTKYCYQVVGSDFQEFLTPSVTWDGDDSNFFWATNYQGSDTATRLFFTTNFFKSSSSPMRYTDGSTWTTFQPIVADPSGTPSYIFTARILIPYYGRLLALNTYEGTDISQARNFFARCRFSQIGNPVQSDAWQSDIFGKGGFIDAPTNEEIISAKFYKNTLIVQFERSTWRLQYVGEYGIPFLWERISSDFGSESTFSTVLFDSGVLAVADKAIVASSGGDVKRIDLDIPEIVYDFLNDNEGAKRVHGIRDFKKELVYWCYPDFNTLQDNQYFPNQTVVYNYRNNTYAFFRNNVTCYGNFQYNANITWDRLDVFWDSYQVGWDSTGQNKLPLIVSGNQQGFAHFYGYPDVETAADSTIDALDQESLSVTDVVVTTGVDVVLEIKNHNLQNDEIIYLTGLNFVVIDTPATAGSTTLNDTIYMVQYVDVDNIRLFAWDQSTKQFIVNFSVTNVGTYVGGGVVALFPRVYVETKDFNPAKQVGQNILSNSIDFLFDATTPSPMNIQLKMNTTLAAQANVIVGNQNIEQSNSKTGYIQNVTLANPCVITSIQHGLLTNDEITPQQVGGTVELNSNNYIVTFIDVNHFSINVDSTAFTAYTSGGYWTQSKQQYYTLSAKYAWHRFFANAYGQYMSIVITNNDEQMAQLSTSQQNFVLNAMKIYFRAAGNNIFGK